MGGGLSVTDSVPSAVVVVAGERRLSALVSFVARPLVAVDNKMKHPLNLFSALFAVSAWQEYMTVIVRAGKD